MGFVVHVTQSGETVIHVTGGEIVTHGRVRMEVVIPMAGLRIETSVMAGTEVETRPAEDM